MTAAVTHKRRMSQQQVEVTKRRRKVRFSDEAEVFSYSNFSNSMDDEERAELGSAIWYTRKDFDAFLRDRVHTVRVWRSVGGDMGELDDYYCVRGLEPYHSPSLNSELHAHRYLCMRTVLKEQRKGAGPERIAEALSQLSSWSMERARRLGQLDEEQAKAYMAEKESNDSSGLVKKKRRRSSTASRGAGVKRRRFSVASGNATKQVPLSSLSYPHRPPVNVGLLKQMNLRFLQQMATTNRGSTEDGLGAEPQQGVSTEDILHDSHMALTSLLNRRRMRRRHSMNGQSVELPFLAIRRDSLHGLQRPRTGRTTAVKNG